MKYEEALKELDEPKEQEFYGVKMMWSKKTGEIIVKSVYGLAYCTRDWPAPFSPTEKDFSADDYKIITSTGEAYL